LAEKPQRDKEHGIRPEELVRLAPKLRPYLRPDPTWPDIVDAADWLRHNLGALKALTSTSSNANCAPPSSSSSQASSPTRTANW
jgi:hypothetical protein